MDSLGVPIISLYPLNPSLQSSVFKQYPALISKFQMIAYTMYKLCVWYLWGFC